MDVEINRLAREMLGEEPFRDGLFRDALHGEELRVERGRARARVPRDSVRIFADL
jgi:hypothetical protein